jgi:hypothetical protein
LPDGRAVPLREASIAETQRRKTTKICLCSCRTK